MVKLILDTDMGCDCDDAGAMAVMHALARQGYCDILAVTHCTSRMCGIGCIDAINRFYGRGDIPVGILQKQGFLIQNEYSIFSRPITNEFPNQYRNAQACENAVSVLRQTLAAQENASVVLAAIGPLSNLYDLMRSDADEFSPLTGIELVTQKINQLCIMGGCFIHQSQMNTPATAEWNIKHDVQAAKAISENWPSPIVFSPYESGAKIKTGKPLLGQGHSNNPVRRAYELFQGTPRESWDLCTVYYAIKGKEDLWDLTPEGIVCFNEHGVSTFREQPGGKHRYLINKAPIDKITRILDDLMLEPVDLVPLQ